MSRTPLPPGNSRRRPEGPLAAPRREVLIKVSVHAAAGRGTAGRRTGTAPCPGNWPAGVVGEEFGPFSQEFLKPQEANNSIILGFVPGFLIAASSRSLVATLYVCVCVCVCVCARARVCVCVRVWRLCNNRDTWRKENNGFLCAPKGTAPVLWR